MDDFDLLDQLTSGDIPVFDEETKECKHLEQNVIGGMSTCVSCGEHIHQVFNTQKTWAPQCRYMRQKEDRNISKDISHLQIEDTVVALANRLFYTVTNGEIRRATSRKSIICACVFEAYKRLGKPQTYPLLGSLFELKQKNALKGLKVVLTCLSKDTSFVTTTITPEVYVQHYMKEMHATADQLEHVQTILKMIYDEEYFNRARPQSIAAGVIAYWLSLSTNREALDILARLTQMSQSTLSKLERGCRERVRRATE